MCLIRNSNSDNEGSLIFNPLFSYLVGCRFCLFERVSLHSSGWPRSMCVDQAGPEIATFLPLFPVPPCPAGSVFKYPVLTWGESLILHFKTFLLEAEAGLVYIQASGQPGSVVTPGLRGQTEQNKTVRLLWRLRQKDRKFQVFLELSEFK